MAGISGLDGAELNPDIKQQFRRQLMAVVVGTSGRSYKILVSPSNLDSVIQVANGGQRTAPSCITGSVSNDHVQYVKIDGGRGGNAVTPSSPYVYRFQQQPPVDRIAAAAPASITANRNTMVKRIVVNQETVSGRQNGTRHGGRGRTTVVPATMVDRLNKGQHWLSGTHVIHGVQD